MIMVSILKLIRTAKQKAKCPFITQKVTNQSVVFAIATKTMRILVWAGAGGGPYSVFYLHIVTISIPLVLS